MLPQSFLDPRTPADVLPAGSLLCARNERATSVLHLDSGRVLLGVREGELLRHQLGTVEGPCWLDVAPALLGQPSVADLVADTTVQVRRVGRSELVRAVAVFNDHQGKLRSDASLQQRPALARTSTTAGF